MHVCIFADQWTIFWIILVYISSSCSLTPRVLFHLHLHNHTHTCAHYEPKIPVWGVGSYPRWTLVLCTNASLLRPLCHLRYSKNVSALTKLCWTKFCFQKYIWYMPFIEIIPILINPLYRRTLLNVSVNRVRNTFLLKCEQLKTLQQDQWSHYQTQELDCKPFLKPDFVL